MNILYIGDLNFGSTSFHRFNALRRTNNIVDSIDTHYVPTNLIENFTFKLFYKLRHPLDKYNINDRIKRMMCVKSYNVVWLNKALSVHPKTLKWIKLRYPQCKVLSYSGDDMLNPSNSSIYHSRSLGFFDYYFTTKSYNVLELENLGCKKAIFVNNAFDPLSHQPAQLTQNDLNIFSADVSFIGGFELDRFEKILFLALNGIKVTVWGYGWARAPQVHQNIIWKNKYLEEGDYSKVITASKINLCFLRKVNRDLQTTRSMEIPACGGFMLGERTEEHAQLFLEGRDAEFFDDNYEMLEKIRLYLSNDELRMSVAINGRERCLDSGYSNDELVSNILDLVTVNHSE